jgi:trigger factor
VNDLETFSVTKEEVEPRQVRLTVEVAEDEIQGEMRRVARQLAQNVRIPGFRPGKAPYRVIAQRYGEDALRVEAAENLIDELFPQIMKQEGLYPFSPAELESMELDPFEFVVLVPLPPEVELGDYRSLRVEDVPAQVEESEIEQVLDRLRETHAVLEPVEDRGAQPGDVLVISVEGITDEGEPFLQDEGVEVVLDPENDNPAPGFYEALEGMRVGEERTFRLDLPEEHSAEEAEFTVELEGLSERSLAELDDDLARTVGDYETLDELTQDIEEQLLERKESEAEEAYVEAVLQALVDQAEIEYPPQAVEDELDNMIENFENRVQRDLRMNLEDYLTAIDKTEEEIRSDLRKQAGQSLERALALGQLVEREDLTVDDDEVEDWIERRLASLGPRATGRKEWLQSAEGHRSALNELLVKKAIERLTTIARGEGDEREQEQEQEQEQEKEEVSEEESED